MAKFAFWIHSKRGVEFQLLHDEAMYNEYDLKHGVAPPIRIKEIFEELPYETLKHIYPCPPEAPMPKLKKQGD
jgi:hypothetical protein